MIAQVKQLYRVDLKTLKNFGFIFAIMVCILFYLAFPFLFSFSYRIWPGVLALVFFAIALLTPSILRFVYVPWMILGNILNFINTRIILGFIYFCMITPLALFFRLIGRDKMDRTIDHTLKSYQKKPQSLRLDANPY